MRQKCQEDLSCWLTGAIPDFFVFFFDVLTLFDKKSLTLSFNSVIMDNDDAYEKWTVFN